MMQSPIVSFSFYNRALADVWRKSKDEWLIVEKGRYGPSWLHRAAFWLVKQLGMVRHQRFNEQKVVTTYLDRHAKTDLFEDMRAACLHGLRAYGFRGDAIKIICGETELDEVMSHPLSRNRVSFDLGGSWNKTMVCDGYDRDWDRAVAVEQSISPMDRRARKTQGRDEFGRNYSRVTIDGVPVHVVPGMKGWIVVPADV